MKKTAAIIIIAVLVLAFSCCLTLQAQESQNQQSKSDLNQSSIQTEADTQPRSRMDFVKTVNFYLKNGRLVFGKLVSEDRNKVTVEMLEGSKLVVSVHGKRDIDIRTLRIKSILEYKYYIDLAEYFQAKTWDFKDDPDDFIQAIRSYEKAKQLLLEARGEESEKVEQLNKKIAQLQADREVWTREVQSRKKLKSLELQVTFESRLKELEDKSVANNQLLDESLSRLDKIIANIENNQQTLADNISEVDRNLSKQLRTLRDQIRTNRRIINRLNYFWDYLPEEREQ